MSTTSPPTVSLSACSISSSRSPRRKPEHRSQTAHLPPAKDPEQVFFVSQTGGVTKDVEATQDRYQRTRDKLKQLLSDGQLDDRDVEIEVEQNTPIVFDMAIPQGAPEGLDGLSDMLKGMMPKRTKKRTVKVPEARRLLLDEELNKLIDLEDVTADALDRTEQLGIIFLDEIDKIAGQRGGDGWP